MRHLLFLLCIFIINDVLCDAKSQTHQQTAVLLQEKDQKSLKLIEDALNQLKTLSAYFVQINIDGSQSYGCFFIERRSNRIKMDYTDPPTNAIVIHNNKVLLFNKELKEKSVVSAYSSPLSFLLDRTIDLQKNVKVLEIRDITDEISITLSKKDKDIDAVVTISFSKEPFMISKWKVFNNKEDFRKNLSTQVILINRALNLPIPDKVFEEFN